MSLMSIVSLISNTGRRIFSLWDSDVKIFEKHGLLKRNGVIGTDGVVQVEVSDEARRVWVKFATMDKCAPLLAVAKSLMYQVEYGQGEARLDVACEIDKEVMRGVFMVRNLTKENFGKFGPMCLSQTIPILWRKRLAGESFVQETLNVEDV